ncbi:MULTISPECIES: 23S rRNA (uracil(1939)-C(5))-methyltransferase RlmD [Vibrio]|uniref:23S rRNA (uracil(1939)-C(5))-methyltransferase RlmD n=1 Tax=Vibrio casei TaxID=673372 RepID=A0A368LLG8_9VIBR|nr:MULTISPECIES: 23S rRNA (uracil(1939)-C(5))-methyltransferase RlmD [Vibrio]RCS72687.1 23S rRNA (uracil(1939)-C(5))-methyltransferase RlmD [Vibrio casei]SJN23573.1 23S rRNA (Uracil-5-)-methyltransferase RumA [Vibrio casei]HBV75675.1 23S rRNA (uracil(1939)-C(5))-methyltransferase RlmD [Vibrio sp.]
MANFYQAKKNVHTSQKHQVVMIEKLDHQGTGIAYVNKKPMFVEGALPAEEVLVQPVEEKSKYIRAKLITIQKPSPQRIAAFCVHYNTCGGCNLQHLSHDDQITMKAQSLSQMMRPFSEQTISVESIIRSESRGYRRRARISMMFDNKTQIFDFGFRQKGSKKIANVTNCPVLDPSLNALLPEIKRLLKSFSQPRQLGHVELVFDGKRKAMLLRHTAELSNTDQASLIEFAKKTTTTLYLLPNSGELHCLIGEPLQCVETGNKIDFLPSDFIQVNQGVNKSMVDQAVSWLEVTKTDRVLDLFCGLGNFSFALAKKAKFVVGVEGIQAMVDRARDNAQLNQLSNTEFYQADLEQDFTRSDWAINPFDKVLLDPARAGAMGVIEHIAKLGAKSVVYVSCNPATLARDSQSLYQQGYELKKLSMMDMFPHTSHLESMALFIKEPKGKKKTGKKPRSMKLF